MKKILTILGARPQFVKAAIVSKAFKEFGFSESYIDTGQHYDHSMNQVFFDELEMDKPKHYLNVGSATHGVQTGAMLQLLDPILMVEKPDLVLVYGDTNSTLAGALAAQKLHIPLAHIEAGLRSFDKKMPEEINRICTDHCADYLFVVADSSRRNLLNEGLADSAITIAGDVMLDSCFYFKERAEDRPNRAYQEGISGDYCVATVHRPSNTDDTERLECIMEALNEFSITTPVLLPIHPRTAKVLEQFPNRWPNIKFTEPLGYLDMIGVVAKASIIITDSGGVQREACFLDVPSVVLRDQTEWRALVDREASTLATPTTPGELLEVFRRMHKKKVNIADFADAFGSGAASKKIAKVLAG